jgi:hypothetical protein
MYLSKGCTRLFASHQFDWKLLARDGEDIMKQSTASILLDCLGYADEAAKADQLSHVTAGQWSKVVELAQQHGVAPLLYHRLKRMGLIDEERSIIHSAHSTTDIAEGLTTENGMELKQAFLENAARNMRLYQELQKLLLLLRKQEIAVIVLKGAYLAEAVYDNIGLRVMGDIDMLVEKDNLLRVEQDMLALGYTAVDFNRVITQENIHFRYEEFMEQGSAGDNGASACPGALPGRFIAVPLPAYGKTYL